ncbi:MAG: hypothetical protein FWC90_08035, partial [Oscillospiraceae bacterium]|nr:hypothetical protein [Oscillospiraceae bacterium]
MKKFIAATLCVVMLISFAGCARISNLFGRSDRAMQPIHLGGDYSDAFAAFGPGVVMLRADDLEVTWGELFFHIRMMTEGLRQHYGILDLDILMSMYAELVLEESVQTVLHFRALEYGAREAGITLSDEELERFNNEMAALLADYDGDESLFAQALWDSMGAYSLAMYEQIAKTSLLSGVMIMHMYGDHAQYLSDEDVRAFTADDGYIMAMHILRSHDDLARGHAEMILDLLNMYTGDDLTDYFAALMHEWTDDPG